MSIPAINSYVQTAARAAGPAATDPDAKPTARHTSQSWYNATHGRPWNASMPPTTGINSMEDVRATPGLAYLAPSYGNATDSSAGYMAGSFLRPFVNHRNLDAAWSGGPLSSALLTGLPLAALGAGGAWLWNRFSNRQMPVAGTAAAAGGLGALLGGYAGHQRAKQATAWRESEEMDMDTLAAAVKKDFSISAEQKTQVIEALSKLSGGQLDQLAKFLSTAAGAGIGALVFRFLSGKGLISTALGAIVGGLVASPKKKTNAFGQSTLGGSRFYS